MFTDLIIASMGETNKYGRAIYTLYQSFTYRTATVLIVIPKGFRTDFASVPRLFWRIIPPAGSYNKATVVHDYLYQSRQCSRCLADAIFREAMTELGVGFVRLWLMWFAVRCFGPRYKIEKPKRNT